jgi:hypothetical protein
VLSVNAESELTIVASAAGAAEHGPNSVAGG